MMIVEEIPDRVKMLAAPIVAACARGAGQHELDALVKSVLEDRPDLEELARHLHRLATDPKTVLSVEARCALLHTYEHVLNLTPPP
ncbi:hypothetical protein OL229_13685 [Neisseriaceae bacterium JH1-16]|nr:hypothetical protein [Neisseriaceae bacterium JH1-16]